jgi:hypothetical protein
MLTAGQTPDFWSNSPQLACTRLRPPLVATRVASSISASPRTPPAVHTNLATHPAHTHYQSRVQRQPPVRPLVNQLTTTRVAVPWSPASASALSRLHPLRHRPALSYRRARQDGSTGLILASKNGHLEVVRLLLGSKADPNLADEVRPPASPPPERADSHPRSNVPSTRTTPTARQPFGSPSGSSSAQEGRPPAAAVCAAAVAPPEIPGPHSSAPAGAGRAGRTRRCSAASPRSG